MIIYNITQSFLWTYFRLVYRLRVTGLDHVPATGGAIIAANHASFLDPPTMGIAVCHRALRYMARDDLFRIPVVGPGMRMMGALPIRRGGANGHALRNFVSRIRDHGEILLVFLEGKGYKVIVASNGKEAIGKYREHHGEIVLVFSDMGLPELSGEQMFYQLLQINPNVKVVLASGYIEPGKKSELFRAGVKEIVYKPYIPDAILKTVRRVIDG